MFQTQAAKMLRRGLKSLAKLDAAKEQEREDKKRLEREKEKA